MKRKFTLAVVFTTIIFASIFINHEGKSYVQTIELVPGEAENVQVLQQPLIDINDSLGKAMESGVFNEEVG
ncbi:hypothetical protein F3157_16210 [Virgibacillus dakarensis]|nr:hypothetical protein [Virgibacillus dakarensis]